MPFRPGGMFIYVRSINSYSSMPACFFLPIHLSTQLWCLVGGSGSILQWENRQQLLLWRPAGGEVVAMRVVVVVKGGVLEEHTLWNSGPFEQPCPRWVLGIYSAKKLGNFQGLGVLKKKEEKKEAVWFPSYFLPEYRHCSHSLAHSSPFYLIKRQKFLLKPFLCQRTRM